MIANHSSKGTGCGCGGGGTSAVSLCSCGGSGCGSCHAQGIVRPRFFAGQLLTEDDLQLLSDYVGQKNRLHNRHLFGAGVVCGLEVTCHPCGDGRVIVHPGYAIDCCGNDLTLSCAQILDINAMVRDLRRSSLRGFECEDPCPDPAKVAKQVPQKTKGENNGEVDDVVKPTFRYCLYVRYCEQPSDPVAPYSTGEDCMQVGCEATRIREGVEFEIRCQPLHDASNPLIQRLCACLGDLTKVPKVFEAIKEIRERVHILSTTKTRKAFGSQQSEELKAAAPVFVEKSKDIVLTREPVNEVASRTAERPQIDLGTERFARRVSPAINPEFLASFATVAPLVFSFEQQPADKQQEILAAQSNRVLLQDLQATRPIIAKFLSHSLTDIKDPFDYVRDWLLERIHNSPFLTDCTLRQRVMELVLPSANSGEGLSQFRIAADNSEEIVLAFIDYLRDCICRVLNPACTPCEDSAVLLACLDLADCQVTKVCNMERTFVLSPAAVRYWLPPLQLLGNVLERYCCVPWNELPTKDNSMDPDPLTVLKEEIARIIKDSSCVVSNEELNQLLGLVEEGLGKVSRKGREAARIPRSETAGRVTVDSEGITATAETGAKKAPAPKKKATASQAKKEAAKAKETDTSEPASTNTTSPAATETAKGEEK